MNRLLLPAIVAVAFFAGCVMGHRPDQSERIRELEAQRDSWLKNAAYWANQWEEEQK